VEPIGNPFRYLPPQSQEEFAFTALVPLQLQAILTESPEKLKLLDQMKGILVGGAPINPELSQQIKGLKVPVYHTYGMTETASHVALKRLNGPEPDLYFKAAPAVQLGQDERGCLTIKGKVTNQQLLITNDLVNLVSAHEFEWLGRIDNTLNSGGVKVQAEKVEVALAQALLEHRLDRRSFISAVPDEKLGQRIIAVLEGDYLPQEEEDKIFQSLQQLLNKYEIPKYIKYTPSFSTTPSGKTDKTATLANLLL
jgi:O-succinylbenzoic acid--CoA ligase